LGAGVCGAFHAKIQLGLPGGQARGSFTVIRDRFD